MVRQPFKESVVAISGDFGKERTRKQLKQWIEVNGGKVSVTMSDEVTHVLCSEFDYKNEVEAVTAAKKLHIPIVNYDWLEDSILKKRKLATRDYEWHNIVPKKDKDNAARRKKEGAKLKQDAKRFTDGCAAAKQDIFSGEYEPFKKSMNRQVMDAFMTDITTRKINAKATRIKTPRAPRVKATAGKGSNKRKADDAARPDGPAEELSPEALEDAELTFIAMNASQKSRRGPIAFSSHGKAYYQLNVPVPDQSAIIRAPTAAEIKLNLLEEANKAFAFPDNYHVYRDPTTGLDFAIMLVRVNITRNTGGERVYLRLYESNAQPHTYAAYFRHSVCVRVEDRILAPVGSEFGHAFDKYANVFRDLTYVDWQHCDRASLKQGQGQKPARRFVRSDGSEVVEVPFVYLKNQPVE